MPEDEFWDIILAKSIFPALKINHKVYQVITKLHQVQKPEVETEEQLESESEHEREREKEGQAAADDIIIDRHIVVASGFWTGF